MRRPQSLAGLHALERLAQNNPAHRQTVIDVLCGYLRMPVAASQADGEPTDSGMAPAGSTASRHDARLERARRVLSQAAEAPDGHSAPVPADPGEHEVRLTAQRILIRHLHRPHGVSAEQADALEPGPSKQFWPGHRPDHPRHSVDLTGAYLVDFHLTNGHLAYARFDRATSSGNTGFGGATFSQTARFREATFSGHARFGGAMFSEHASFGGARVRELMGHVWPIGWTLVPDPNRRGAGLVVPTNSVEVADNNPPARNRLVG